MGRPRKYVTIDELHNEIKDIKENHLPHIREQLSSIKGKQWLLILLVVGMILEVIFRG